MAIIKQKDIFDDSKKVFTNLNKELDTLHKKTEAQTKANLKLSESLQAVKKSGDGKEARALTEATNKLTVSTRKVTKAKSDAQIVAEKLVKANRALNQTYTPQAKALTILRQKTLQQNKALREQAKAQLGLKKSTGGLVRSFKKLGAQMLGALGVIGIVLRLVQVVTDAFNTFTKFEKSSSKLAAVLGKTKKEITSLTKQAKELGSTTAFTASQVIELQTELAKLGFSQNDIKNMTSGILDLAAATGSELASAAELAGSTLRIFNLDSSEMARVTDVLALSTSKSSLSMEKLATIMPTVGKTAQIAGVSLERTAALAGTLTDRGLDASTAGTALRNIFLKLAKDGRTWDGAMSEMNGSTDKLKTSIELFGVRSSAAGIILSETAGSVDTLTAALNDADGAAQDMADTMLDNVSGDITKATSAWEGFVLSVADGSGGISVAIRDIVQGFTAFLGQITLFNKTNVENKLKLIANAFLALIEKAFFPLIEILRSFGVEIPKLRFEIDEVEKSNKALGKTTEGLNKVTRNQKKLIDEIVANTKEETKATKELTAAQLKQLKVEKDRLILKNIAATNKAVEREEGKIDSDLDDQIAEDEAKLNQEQKFQDDKVVIQDSAAEQKKVRDKEIAEAEQSIKEQALTSGQQLASDIFSSFQDEKLAKITSDAEAEKKILQQKLDDGLITEEEFAKKSADIDKKGRIASAKADKKKAIFDIAIATAIGIIKAFSTLGPILGVPAAVQVGIIGAIQAAAVAAKPIPKFAEGTEYIEGAGTGKSDSIHAMVSKGERIVPAEINQMLNGIPNKDLPKLVNSNDSFTTSLALNGLIAHTKKTNDLIGNLYSSHVHNGFLHIKLTNGNEIKQPIIKQKN